MAHTKMKISTGWLNLYMPPIEIVSKEEQIRLLEAYKAGDREAGDQLIRSVLAWAVKYTSRLVAYQSRHGRRYHQIDLMAAAHLGAYEAVNRWEPERGALSSAVSWGVRSAVTRAAGHLHPGIRIPDMPAAKPPSYVDSFDEWAGMAELPASAAPGSTLPDAPSGKYWEWVDSEVPRLIAGLRKRNKRLAGIVQARLEQRTLQSLGEELGISRERVRQLEKQAMVIMQELARGDFGG